MSKKNRDLTLLQRIALEVLWILCRLFAILPHFVRHNIVGYVLYLVLAYVLRYRQRVIMQNLRNSFPDKSDKELREI